MMATSVEDGVGALSINLVSQNSSDLSAVVRFYSSSNKNYAFTVTFALDPAFI